MAGEAGANPPPPLREPGRCRVPASRNQKDSDCADNDQDCAGPAASLALTGPNSRAGGSLRSYFFAR